MEQRAERTASRLNDEVVAYTIMAQSLATLFLCVERKRQTLGFLHRDLMEQIVRAARKRRALR